MVKELLSRVIGGYGGKVLEGMSSIAFSKRCTRKSARYSSAALINPLLSRGIRSRETNR